jgi:hypothetical protein
LIRLRSVDDKRASSCRASSAEDGGAAWAAADTVKDGVVNNAKPSVKAVIKLVKIEKLRFIVLSPWSDKYRVSLIAH